jgi:acrylyl-CoA reductase (NADPH)
MSSFRALLVSKTDIGQKAEITTLTEADLMDGDVTIRVEHSSVNYKDGLAVTGKGPIIRRWPLIPGIDIAGTVSKSEHKDYKVGDKVVLGGWGVGEGHHGGYAEVARVKGDWLVPLPKGLTTSDAMAVGVAGYTAMLCVMALEEQGVTPDKGEIIVTGAAGGVGSVALVLLAKLGYTAVASTGRVEEEAFLRSLGAASIVNRAEFSGPAKPLAKARWAGAIDNVGSTTLANVLSQMKDDGVVTAVGLAQGMDLPT